MASTSNGQPTPPTAAEAVLMPSENAPENAIPVSGPNFDDFSGRNVSAAELLASMRNVGFQASSLSQAADIINQMRTWKDPETSQKPTIFLGYTSNLISSGLRDTFRWLVQHRHVSAIVTTAGGVEEDFIKCLAPTYITSSHGTGAQLRARGLNRINNLIVPNNNYCKFEDWLVPILDAMLAEQEASKKRQSGKGQGSEEDGDHDDDEDEEKRVVWTPSSVIRRLGKEINDPESVYYWAYKNDIPVFCPALTDGSLGDMLYFHTFKSSPQRLVIDLVSDIRRINDLARSAVRAGIIILGGGVVKHHIANACLFRNGAEYAVYVNTAVEYDGSDAGAPTDEAVSWGKIRADASAVKVHAEATAVFPLLVAATFASHDEGK